MHIRKMHGCGNDFLLVTHEDGIDYSELAPKILHRKLGIGADGLIVVKTNPIEMKVFSPNGSRILSNGNALRCVAKYAYELGLARRGKIEIITGNGIVETEVIGEHPFKCQVNLGKPNYNNSMLSLIDDLDCFGRTIQIGNKYITIYSLYLGDIHTVVFVDSLYDDVIKLAEQISEYYIFSKGTNVDFVEVRGKDKLKVKTYERGVGFTMANSDGCAAALVVAQKLGYTKVKAKVELELGIITTEITKKGTVLVAGPAEEVFSCDL